MKNITQNFTKNIKLELICKVSNLVNDAWDQAKEKIYYGEFDANFHLDIKDIINEFDN